MSLLWLEEALNVFLALLVDLLPALWKIQINTISFFCVMDRAPNSTYA